MSRKLAIAGISLLLLGGPTAAEEPPLQLSLQECLRLVVERNPGLHAQLAMTGRAAGSRTVLRGTALPTLQINPSGGLQGPRGASDLQTFGILVGDFSQPLFDLRIPPSWKMGDALVAAAVQNYWVAVNRALHEARLLYVQAALDAEWIALLDRQAATFQEVAGDLGTVMEAGLASDVEVGRAQLRAAQLRSALPGIRERRQHLLLQLATQMGYVLPPNSDWIQTVQLISPVEPHGARPSFAPLYQQGLQHRPDFKLLRHFQQFHGAEAQLAFAQQLPIFSFDVILQSIPRQTASNTTALQIAAGSEQIPTAAQESTNNTIQNDIRFGPSMEWLVFDGGASIGEMQAARALALKNRVTEEGLQVELGADLRVALSQWMEADRILRETSDDVSLAEETSEAALVVLQVQDAPKTLAGFGYVQDEDQVIRLEDLRLSARLMRARAAAAVDFLVGNYLRLEGLEPPVRLRE